MKTLLVLFMLVFMVGCSNTLTSDEMTYSRHLCNNNGGLDKGRVESFFSETYFSSFCKDGSIIKKKI